MISGVRTPWVVVKGDTERIAATSRDRGGAGLGVAEGVDTTKQHDWHTTGRLGTGAWKLAEGGWPSTWQARGIFETRAWQERGRSVARRVARRVAEAWQRRGRRRDRGAAGA